MVDDGLFSETCGVFRFITNRFFVADVGSDAGLSSGCLSWTNGCGDDCCLCAFHFKKPFDLDILNDDPSFSIAIHMT